MAAKPFLFLCVVLNLLVASSATAIPADLVPRTTCPLCTQSYEANFDNITAPPAGVENPLNVPQTPYEGLKYQGLVVQSQPAVPALKFHSKDNNAIVDTLQTLTGNTPAITKDYPYSKVQTFDFKSFYFGCKLSSAEQGNGGPAQACTVQITGYKQSSSSPSVCDVVTASCTFTPPSTLSLFNVPEVQCVLPSTFNGLTNATFAVSNAEVAKQVTVLYTDDFVYTTRSICCP